MIFYGYIKESPDNVFPSQTLYRKRERLMEVLKPLCEKQAWLEQVADGSATDFVFIDRGDWVGLEYSSAHFEFRQETTLYWVLEYAIEGEAVTE